jgi:protein SCO1/2
VQRILGDRVGKDIFFYSISIDPQRDTPEELADYAEAYNAGPGWYFLTGKKEDVELIRKKLGVQNRPGSDPLTGHSTSLVLGNENTGQWTMEGAMDDPHYIAVMVGDWLDEWKHSGKVESFANAPKPGTEASDPGAYLFKTRCVACHSIGGGDGIGPDLAGVTARRSKEWLERFISAPDKMIAEKDKIALELFEHYKLVRMPNLRLGPKDTAAIIGYLEKERGTRASVR